MPTIFLGTSFIKKKSNGLTLTKPAIRHEDNRSLPSPPRVGKGAPKQLDVKETPSSIGPYYITWGKFPTEETAGPSVTSVLGGYLRDKIK